MECAYSVSRSKGTYLAERFRQVRRRRGEQRAIVAVAYDILNTSWWLLTTGKPYDDFGPETLRRQAEEQTRQRLLRQLERLGYQVTVKPAA